MDKIIWHESAKELPKEGQFVACLRANTGRGDKNYSSFIAIFENGQFMVYVNCDNYFSADNQIAMSYHCKMTLKDVVVWSDANDIFHTADELLDKINSNQ